MTIILVLQFLLTYLINICRFLVFSKIRKSTAFAEISTPNKLSKTMYVYNHMYVIHIYLFYFLDGIGILACIGTKIAAAMWLGCGL